MKTRTHLWIALIALVSTHSLAIEKERAEIVEDGIKEMSVCTKFLQKPEKEKSNAVGNSESRIKALLYNNQIVVAHHDVIDILKLNAEKIEIYERENGKSKLKEAVKYKKDPIAFLSEIDNLEQIIEDALTEAQEAKEDDDQNQAASTYAEETDCALQIVKLIKKEYSKK